jgi:hypothetical protein
MKAVSRRAFLTTTGVVTGGALASREVSSAAAPALTLCCANYVRFLPIATGDVQSRDLPPT